jgi:hypothetical protein
MPKLKRKGNRRAEENKLRDRARVLVQEIDKRYWELGRVLYEVYDYRAFSSGDGAMRERKAMFRRWGYKNFGDYCEKGLGIKKRTGENLRFAYSWFVIQQKMPVGIIRELITVGRSKVYLLAGFATKSNVRYWLKKANGMTFEELKTAIMTSKNVARPVGAKRSLRVDVCALVKYLCNIEFFLKRHGKKMPADVHDIVRFYEDQAGVHADLRLVA